MSRRDHAHALIWMATLARIDGDRDGRDACLAAAYRVAGAEDDADRHDLLGEAQARWHFLAPSIPRHDRTEGW